MQVACFIFVLRLPGIPGYLFDGLFLSNDFKINLTHSTPLTAAHQPVHKGGKNIS